LINVSSGQGVNHFCCHEQERQALQEVFEKKFQTARFTSILGVTFFWRFSVLAAALWLVKLPLDIL